MITPASVGFVEEFHVWKASGGGELMERPAREAEALLLLEAEVRRLRAENEQSI